MPVLYYRALLQAGDEAAVELTRPCRVIVVDNLNRMRFERNLSYSPALTVWFARSAVFTAPDDGTWHVVVLAGDEPVGGSFAVRRKRRAA